MDRLPRLAAISTHLLFVAASGQIAHPHSGPSKFCHYLCETPKGAGSPIALWDLEQVQQRLAAHALQPIKKVDLVFDARFNNSDQYPVAAKSGSGNTRNTPDKTTAKLAALHFYQLSIPAPKAPAGSFDKTAFERGKTVFNGSAKCATCHVPPLYSEPGNNLHAPGEIGIDAFQADRSPTHMYRTSPLAGLWTHQKGGFFHDGRFATLLDVVNHYDTQFNLNLSDANKRDLVEYLKGI